VLAMDSFISLDKEEGSHVHFLSVLVFIHFCSFERPLGISRLSISTGIIPVICHPAHYNNIQLKIILSNCIKESSLGYQQDINRVSSGYQVLQ